MTYTLTNIQRGDMVKLESSSYLGWTNTGSYKASSSNLKKNAGQ
jgi:hypothetical protein